MPTILLKDKQGNPRGYNDVETIVVKDTEDNNVEYNNISTMELQVTSNGDYIAPKGKAYSKVGVSVPNLLVDRCNATLTELRASDLVGATRIAQHSFYNLIALVSAEIPDSVTYLEVGAFQYDSDLVSVAVGTGVIEIAAQCFGFCTKLKSFTCWAVNPPVLNNTAFNNVPADCAIYVPAGSVDTYKAASNWSNRAAYIQAIPE